MKFIYWIKFSNNNKPNCFEFSNFEEMWHDLREFIMHNNTGHIEWMIRD